MLVNLGELMNLNNLTSTHTHTRYINMPLINSKEGLTTDDVKMEH